MLYMLSIPSLIFKCAKRNYDDFFEDATEKKHTQTFIISNFHLPFGPWSSLADHPAISIIRWNLRDQELNRRLQWREELDRNNGRAGDSKWWDWNYWRCWTLRQVWWCVLTVSGFKIHDKYNVYIMYWIVLILCSHVAWFVCETSKMEVSQSRNGKKDYDCHSKQMVSSVLPWWTIYYIYSLWEPWYLILSLKLT